MNKNKLIYISLLVLFLVSCGEDFLDRKPLDTLSSGTVWSDPDLAEAAVFDIYANIGGGFLGLDFIASYVDEGNFTPDWGIYDFNRSLMSPDNLPRWGAGDSPNTQALTWSNLYGTIRACNDFFDHYDQIAFDEAAEPGRAAMLKGEVHFLRAYLYHNLTSLYGGVPIIQTKLNFDDDLQLPRDTYEDCINFIVSDLDAAINLLPEPADQPVSGRATRGAAMALKSRVLLHAASELRHNQSWTNGYSHFELVGYENADRMQMWRDARDAAKAVIDADYYALHNAVPAPTDSVPENLTEIFLSYSTEEDIFTRHLYAERDDSDWWAYDPGLHCGPNGYHNWGNNTPTQDLVDDFEMSDGSEFDWDNPDHASDPYANRDPRFYSTVLYDGAKWGTRPDDMIDRDPLGYIETALEVYYTVKDENGAITDTAVRAGWDTRGGPVEDWNGTYTGYYLRKFLDPSIDHQFEVQDYPWRFIRYAEVILNYVEACIELGEEDEARTYLNMIRTRAGMPDVTDTGDDLKERYRNERRIELAFEEHRFWDVRRWMVGTEGYHDMHGIELERALLPGPEGETSPEPTSFEVFVFENRAWSNKAYLFPISTDEMNRNTNLIQNPGY